MQVVKKTSSSSSAAISCCTTTNPPTAAAASFNKKKQQHRHHHPDYYYEIVRQLSSTNAVVVFSTSACCMCTVAKRLLFGLGVGPTIIELDHHFAGADIQAVLFQLAGEGRQQQQPVPTVFVGGKFLGGIETLMACHINGTLVPLLKDAGALWL